MNVRLGYHLDLSQLRFSQKYVEFINQSIGYKRVEVTS